MEATQRWARGASLVAVSIGWSHVQERRGHWRWRAEVATLAPWVTKPGTGEPNEAWRRHAQAWGTWVATLLTEALPTLERLAARGVDPVEPLRLLAFLEQQRPYRQAREQRTRSAKQLRAHAALIDRTVSVLKRYERELEHKTPLAFVGEGTERELGRRLYAWTLELLPWVSEMLRGVAPSRGRRRETEARVAALALQRIGLQVVEISTLLIAAGFTWNAGAGQERTQSLLGRARRDKTAVAAAQRLLGDLKLVAPGGTPGPDLHRFAQERSRKA